MIDQTKLATNKFSKYEDFQDINILSNQLESSNSLPFSKVELMKSLDLSDHNKINDLIKIERYSETNNSQSSSLSSDSSESKTEFERLQKQLNSRKFQKKSKQIDKQKIDFACGFHKLNALRNHDSQMLKEISKNLKSLRIKPTSLKLFNI